MRRPRWLSSDENFILIGFPSTYESVCATDDCQWDFAKAALSFKNRWDVLSSHLVSYIKHIMKMDKIRVWWRSKRRTRVTTIELLRLLCSFHSYRCLGILCWHSLIQKRKNHRTRIESKTFMMCLFFFFLIFSLSPVAQKKRDMYEIIFSTFDRIINRLWRSRDDDASLFRF